MKTPYERFRKLYMLDVEQNPGAYKDSVRQDPGAHADQLTSGLTEDGVNQLIRELVMPAEEGT